jgi:pimeloyl-ACP methyl ester carboxylesterase
MKPPEFRLYIPGVGNEPKEQEHLPELWGQFGFEVEFAPIDWTETNYEERLTDIAERANQLSQLGRVSLVGASGGGKAALSLFARQPDAIHKIVTISTKINPYNLHPDSQAKYPNLVLSSDMLPSDLQQLSVLMRTRILCVHPLTDDVVKPTEAVLAGAHELTVQAHDHIEGIRRALLMHGRDISEFLSTD